MEQVILEYDDKYQFYCISKTLARIGFAHLAPFLTGDVGCHAIKFYKEWLNNPLATEGGGNYSHLEKRENSVKIWFEYDWFNETLNAEVLTLSIAELNYILDRWQEACEKKPKK